MSALFISPYLLIVVILSSLFVPLIAYGQIVGCTGLSCTLSDLLAIPVNIYNFMLGMAAVVFLGVIVWAGVRMVAYNLSEMPEAELQAAKTTLSRGIVGIMIIALAYTIVNLLLLTVLGVDSCTYLGKFLIKAGLLAGSGSCS